jgi:hypothetical protein
MREMEKGRWEAGEGRWERGDGRWEAATLLDPNSEVGGQSTEVSHL